MYRLLNCITRYNSHHFNIVVQLKVYCTMPIEKASAVPSVAQQGALISPLCWASTFLCSTKLLCVQGSSLWFSATLRPGYWYVGWPFLISPLFQVFISPLTSSSSLSLFVSMSAATSSSICVGQVGRRRGKGGGNSPRPLKFLGSNCFQNVSIL